jgi:hypothetical protein
VPQIQEIPVGKKSVSIDAVRGEVVGEKKWTSTHVSGGGSSGYVSGGSGTITTSPVTSQVTEHDQFFLRTAQGKEIEFNLQNAKLGVRTDHVVSVVTARWSDRDSGPIIEVHNHTTDRTITFAKEIDRFAPGSFIVSVSILIALAGLGMGLWGVWMIATHTLFTGEFYNRVMFSAICFAVAGLAWWPVSRNRARCVEFNAAVRAALQAVKTQS